MTTANLVALNTTSDVKGVSVVDGSKVTVSESGVYNIQIALRIKSTSGSNDVINVWIAKNGTNISQTNSPMTIGAGFAEVASWNFVVNLNANEYIQVYWSCATTTSISLEAYPASASPTKPQTPSASVTAQQIGRTDAGWDQPQLGQGQVLGRAAGAASGTIQELPFSNPVDYGDFSNVLISSGTSNTANSWTPLEPYNATLYGAVSDGITDNAAAFTAANAGAPSIVLTSGTYYVDSNVTFTKPVTIESGAVIKIPNGVTVAFNGGLNAGVYQVFNCTGTGKVTFDPSTTSTGYPEWWGALKNTVIDNYTYIMACVTACAITEFQLGDYWLDTTLKITDSYKTLVGKGNYFEYTGSCTRLLIAGGTKVVLQIGPDTQPVGGINYFPKNFILKNMYISRSEAPLSNTGSTGVLIKYSLFASIDEVRCAEHDYGFHFIGTVASVINKCHSFRSVTNPASVGSPVFWGFYVDGVADVIAAGGNASLYFNYCIASAGITNITNSVGWYLNGSFSDCYIANGEMNTLAIGIFVNSNNPVSAAANVDLLITDPVIDVFRIAGIYINDTNTSGAISINGGYCAPYSNASSNPALNTAVAGIYLNGSNAQIEISNFQIIAFPNVLCRGIVAIDSSNIESKTQIVNLSGAGLSIPSIALSNVTNSRFLDHITNPSFTSVGAAVQLVSNCSRNYFQVFANSSSVAFTVGYQVIGTTNTYNEFNCTGMDQNGISGDKLNINGVAITTTGLVGTNLASGVMN